MIENIILAVIIAPIVGLLLVGLLGPILKSLAVPIAVTVGEFFVKYGWVLGVLAWVLGVLAGLWYFFAGGPILGFGGKR